MYGLVFTDPGGNRVFEVLSVDRALTVGRATDVDIALPFKAVSRYHARFVPDGSGLWVEDLGSANGVLVGGVRIGGPTSLGPGDQVRIGVIEVTVVGPDGGAYATATDEAAVLDEVPTDPRLASVTYQPPGLAQGPTDPTASYDRSNPFFELAPWAAPPPAPAAHPSAPQPGPYQQPQPAPAVQVPELMPLPTAPPGAAQWPTAGAEPEASPEAPTVALPVVPRLIGQSGYLKDKVFYLDKPEVTVGRVKGCTIVVEDASVSRSHAKVLRKDDGFVVFDLRSFNGTFVNDEKVTRKELNGGETVRFGDVAFTFLLHDTGPAGDRAKAARRPSRRRRLVLLGSAVVVLGAAVLAANILRSRQPPPPPPDPMAAQRAREAEVRAQLEHGAAELRRRDWESATTTLQGVLRLDPLNEEAVRGLEKARVEEERGDWLEESKRIAETGRDLERARALLTKVPEESAYFADAKIALRQVDRSLAEEARSKGLSLCRAWRYEECQQELCRFFQTWPAGEPIADEVRVRRALEQAEAQLSRRRRDEFVPCTIPVPGTGDAEADRVLAERYPDEKVRRAVVAYYQGRADDGVRGLSALEKNRDYAEQRELIGRLIENMIRVQTASADAHRDVRAGALEEAERTYEGLARADSRIVPTGLTSRYVREASKLFGDAYEEVGATHERAGRLREAYQAWAKGKELAPSHPAILQSLLTLESRAREACQAARERALAGDTTGAASHFELCRDITPPSSPLHQGAEEGLRQLGL